MLIDVLKHRQTPFHVIAPARTGVQHDADISLCKVGNPLGRRRQQLVENFVQQVQPTNILFFGNIPSPKPISGVSTYTYFQNAHLIRFLSKGIEQPIKDKLRYWALRRFVKKTLRNTDYWIFQTHFIKNHFEKEYGIGKNTGFVFPFFDLSHLQNWTATNQAAIKRDRNSFVFLSEGYPHKNHSRLIRAWEILNSKHGLQPKLHLTVGQPHLINSIKSANESGCSIENHGFLERDKALALVQRCEFTVFPSLLETIGLGLVEGSLLGTKVICSDSQAFSEVIRPSATFDAMDSENIAEVIASSLSDKDQPPSNVLIENRLEQMIDFIVGS
jgi:glycosyltransferase involved in cell wall biosynthesis